MFLFIKELFDYILFISEEKKRLRTLVFYSEKDIYYQYYEGYIKYIIDHSDLDICYITSDINDPVFKMNEPRFKPIYFKEFLTQVILNLDSKALVMTMPDLDNLYLKRSKNPVNHVYMFHGVGSTHLTYYKNAFDHYDTILCVGPRDIEEIRKAEETYNLKRKNLINCGYYRIEKIYNDHQNFIKEDNSRRKILIAPSWNPGNILESCIDSLIKNLKDSEFDVVIRPHPEFIKRKWDNVVKIQKNIKGISNLTLELDMVKGTSIYQADILITDWSAISFEYAFGTERPVLFINTPPRVDNPDYKELGIEPLEFIVRNQIGKSVEIDDIGNIQSICKDFIDCKELYKNKIINYREKYLFNWLNSSKAGGEAIIELCK